MAKKLYKYTFRMCGGCFSSGDGEADSKKEMERKIRDWHAHDPDPLYRLDKILSIKQFKRKNHHKYLRLELEFQQNPLF